MTKNLLIVESPAKAKTIKKYLGKDFTVLASYGHVRDLIPKTGAVDPNNDFAMKYATITKNAKHVDEIVKALKKSEVLYLATDPDREGEAISWHIYELMREKKALKKQPVHRVVFHEITKNAVQKAVENPREISMDLVDAQQTRRALDYLVGFNISPLLWKKIRPGLSAGRVQSPALRMIVERELEIEKFISREYWTLAADLTHTAQEFDAKLTVYQQQKLEQFSITDEQAARKIEQALLDAANGHLTVAKIEKKQRSRNPAAPFTTSTLQQEAARKLGFTTNRTMRLAQQLYEGVQIGSESVGLITYMRTDSVTLGNESLEEIRALITEKYGLENLPEKARTYKTKAKNAQEAHEAIRPTSCRRNPDEVSNYLTTEQWKLYNLIWQRTIASQMINAILDIISVDLACGAGTDNLFRATGSTITTLGFMSVYLEGSDDATQSDNEKLLPPMKVGDKIDLLTINSLQHFTEPPPRYTEASLVKALEEHGIGRPSTYVAIIDTLQHREYALLENKRFKPTDIGRVVNKFLTTYFNTYVDYNFTANLENQLDEIANGENHFLPLLKAFWFPLKELIDTTELNVKRQDVTQEILTDTCPKCGLPLSKRLGRKGNFIGCTGYPECDYTANIEPSGDTEPTTEPNLDRSCPLCAAPLQIKHGRFGKFIGCSGYPNCKHIEPIEKPSDTGVTCPTCKEGTMLKRKSRYGKYFYSCSKYPDCKYATWNEPINEPCPKCGWPIMTIKVTKKYGPEKVCPQKECGHKIATTED